MNGPNGIGLVPCNAGWKARNCGKPTSRSEAHLIPNPIRKVLSSIRAQRVRALLMGGQACVFYGAAEFRVRFWRLLFGLVCTGNAGILDGVSTQRRKETKTQGFYFLAPPRLGVFALNS
jgi:hypothetical protein